MKKLLNFIFDWLYSLLNWHRGHHFGQLCNIWHPICKCVFFSTPGSGEQYDLGKFFGASWRPFREKDLHPMNIIDLDIGPHQRTMKHTFSIPNLIKDFSLGHTYTSRMDPSIREEFDFTAGISNYLLMTEQEAQTDWHQDFSGTSVFLLFVEGKERIIHRRANPESPKAFWRMAKEWMEKVCKKENSVFISV